MSSRRTKLVVLCLLGLFVLGLLMAWGQAVRLNRTLHFIWYDQQGAVEIARRECLANPALPEAGPAALRVDKAGLIVEVAPSGAAQAPDAVRVRIFRAFNGRLESVRVYDTTRWRDPKALDQAPGVLDLAQTGGLIAWYAVAARTGALDRYAAITAPPAAPLPLD